MPVSGLVVLCRADDSTSVTEAIRLRRGWTLGTAPSPERIPAVVETDTEDGQRDELAWARDLPGVQSVEIVYVHYGTDAPEPPASSDSEDPQGVAC